MACMQLLKYPDFMLCAFKSSQDVSHPAKTSNLFSSSPSLPTYIYYIINPIDSHTAAI